MESLDLDINNYNLNDILRLFKLSINIQENDIIFIFVTKLQLKIYKLKLNFFKKTFQDCIYF